MTEWSLNPIFGSYAAIAALMLGMVALLVFQPTFGRVTPLRRSTLILIRLAVALLILLAMLRPTHIYTSTKQQSAVVLLMVDFSRSMTLPSAVAGKTRWQEQRDTLTRIEDALRDLRSDYELRVYGYDDRLHTIDLDGGRLRLPEEPAGDQTDIGTTLHDAIGREVGKRLMAAILLGDGTQTAFAPRVEIPEAGRELARLAYPLYAVTYGQAGDVAQARDVSVENLPEQYTVFVKNELAVKGALRVRGYVNQPISLELIAEDPQGQTTRVATVQVVAREDNQLLPIEMTFVPPQPGSYKLTLRTATQPGERVTRNNELSAFVTVLEGGLRVLYLYGDLVGEQRLLRRSINMSPDIQLDDVYVDPKNRDRWPISLTEELEPQNLDVLLIENVDSSALGAANLKTIGKLVESGKGFMMLGGFHSFGPGGYREGPLGDVLPVELGRFERQDIGFDQAISRDLHWWGELPLALGDPHPVTTLAPGADNELVWKSLPPLQGANKFRGIKPRSRVLLETPDKKPLLVSGDYGRGRVLALAGDSTHHWWMQGHKLEHQRFWRQVVLWLARRDDLDQNEVWLKLAQRRFNPGAEVKFTAGAKSATGEPLADVTYDAQLVSEDESRQPIQLSRDGDTMKGTIAEIEQAGEYLVELTVSRQGTQLGSTRATFQVLDRDIELSNSAAGHEQMARLAALTKESGGQALAPEQLSELLRDLQQRREELQIEVQTKWQLGDTALDAWLFVLLVVGLLTAEWVLRKRWGLV